MPPPPVAERAYALLREAERGLDGLGAQVDITETRFLAATYSEKIEDVFDLAEALKEQG